MLNTKQRNKGGQKSPLSYTPPKGLPNSYERLIHARTRARNAHTRTHAFYYLFIYYLL
nr:MAG TPA: hypothetical protein [Microviridae sp.]